MNTLGMRLLFISFNEGHKKYLKILNNETSKGRVIVVLFILFVMHLLTKE